MSLTKLERAVANSAIERELSRVRGTDLDFVEIGLAS
jgi:hypothetical protein